MTEQNSSSVSSPQQLLLAATCPVTALFARLHREFANLKSLKETSRRSTIPTKGADSHRCTAAPRQSSFLGAVAALSIHSPSTLSQCVRHREDGSYCVRFPKYMHEEIVVPAPSEADLDHYPESIRSQPWLAALESAFGQLEHIRQNRKGVYPRYSALMVRTDPSVATAVVALQTLTGNPVHSYDLSRFRGAATIDLNELATFRADLSSACENGRAVTAFKDGQIFIVLGCDGNRITLREPWHGGAQCSAGCSYKGVFDVSYDRFVDLFSEIAIVQLGGF